MKQPVKKIIRKLGYKINKVDTHAEFPIDFNKTDIEIIKSVKQFTLTSIERRFALIQAVNYIIKNKIAGDIVESGVWKGGSIMLIAKTLLELKSYDKELYLFDTYEGMTEPKKIDISTHFPIIGPELAHDIESNSIETKPNVDISKDNKDPILDNQPLTVDIRIPMKQVLAPHRNPTNKKVWVQHRPGKKRKVHSELPSHRRSGGGLVASLYESF